MKPFTYLIIDLACLSIPFITSFHKKFPFRKEWIYFFPANILVAVFFLAWDYWFTQIGVWGFNPNYLIGIYVFNLPIEEILFFICIPYACTFTYFVCKMYFSQKIFAIPRHLPISILLIISISLSVIYLDKLYTFYTSICLVFALLFVWIKKININTILISYVVILPFFFISNGILTGSLIESPIVWYNNAENIGIRLITIPLEDIFYGFLLILLNVLCYEKLKEDRGL